MRFTISLLVLALSALLHQPVSSAPDPGLLRMFEVSKMLEDPPRASCKRTSAMLGDQRTTVALLILPWKPFELFCGPRIVDAVIAPCKDRIPYGFIKRRSRAFDMGSFCHVRLYFVQEVDEKAPELDLRCMYDAVNCARQGKQWPLEECVCSISSSPRFQASGGLFPWLDVRD